LPGGGAFRNEARQLFLAGLRLGIVFLILIHLEQIASGRSIVAALFGQNAPN
jgi:hypothetical protein